ncbi:MAG TPA: bacillithiol biosynthesis deacetylase BshB1 [Bacillus sp. (in: firmicutes)]|uniref:bacillithiol biosynthesis deacetylase BshB1 n=1 Tax=Bacillus litorisediminis TaxID=2922713 RepID=UPI0028BE13DB|nr:bacillithiol biosynthesis deacetylase BshB1 [Bacillus litorisediminis]HWO76375.1 bacillithiol biosynthesis deacetylase BshB1 [Bacillus sp. (in: firmicutes)]
MNQSSLHVLAFGAHPDDVEIGMAGTLAKLHNEGLKTGICDLTLADLSSNGTVDIRKKEADAAAEILGCTIRVNLGIPDRGIRLDNEQISKVVTVIRTYKPKLIFIPYQIDRHPDHGWCARLVEEAVFSSAIKNYRDTENLPSHRADAVYYYFINGFHKPDFCVDISETITQKIASLKAYASQFSKADSDRVETPLTNGYIETVEARERMMGKEVGVIYAEGFKTARPLLLDSHGLGVNQ